MPGGCIGELRAADLPRPPEVLAEVEALQLRVRSLLKDFQSDQGELKWSSDAVQDFVTHAAQLVASDSWRAFEGGMNGSEA